MTLQTLIKSIIATIIISFVIWTRFFRQRDTVAIFSIPIELIIISNICLITFFCFLMYTNMKQVFHKNTPSLFTKTILELNIIKKLQSLIQEYILNAPEFLYKQITKNIDLQPLLEKPASYFTAYCNYPKIIVIGFLELPLILVSTFFIIDNIFFLNLKHFYISLSFLIPLLLMRIWLFIIMSYSIRWLDHLAQFLNVFYITNENRYLVTIKPDKELPISETFPIPLIKAKFIVLCNFWEIYSKIYSFIKHIDSYRNSYKSYVQIYTSFCFFIGWSIQLFYNINTYLTFI